MNEVLTHLQFVDLDKNSTTDYTGKRDYLQKLYPGIDLTPLSEISLVLMYKDRLSQPFKPEMITELFLNIVQQNNLEGNPIPSFHSPELWNRNSFKFDFSFWDGIATYVGSANGTDWVEIETTTPATLDDFIRDCQRAKIELRWK